MQVSENRLALRDFDLNLHEIEARDGLGDRMLDLQASVDLEEVEVAHVRAVENELDRAEADVRDRLADADRGLDHALAHGRSQHDARRLLDHLLMASLDRALTLKEMRHVAVCVTDDLDLTHVRTLID